MFLFDLQALPNSTFLSTAVYSNCKTKNKILRVFNLENEGQVRRRLVWNSVEGLALSTCISVWKPAVSRSRLFAPGAFRVGRTSTNTILHSTPFTSGWNTVQNVNNQDLPSLSIQCRCWNAKRKYWFGFILFTVISKNVRHSVNSAGKQSRRQA